jgi:hypothetical protein
MSSYNFISDSPVHYGRYNIGQHYMIGHHPQYGGNSAHEYWDYFNSPTYRGHEYLNQYGGNGYTSTVNTWVGGRRKRRKTYRKRR